MRDIDKIKAYWMATVAEVGDARGWWEREVWSTKEGLQDLIDWFDAELELGLTEEEMDEAIEATAFDVTGR